jgi:hypothetical protein
VLFILSFILPTPLLLCIRHDIAHDQAALQRLPLLLELPKRCLRIQHFIRHNQGRNPSLLVAGTDV